MYQKSNRSISIEQMNAELQQAHLDLLNAHCATHQIRLRYSTADLARFGLTLPRRLGAGLSIGAAGTMVSLFVLLWAGAFQDGPRALPVWIIAGLGLAQFTTRREGTS